MKRLQLTAGSKSVAIGKRGKDVKLPPRGRKVTLTGIDGLIKLDADEVRTFVEEAPAPIPVPGRIKWKAPIRADFLNAHPQGPMRYTHLYAGMDDSERFLVREEAKAKDHNVVALYPLNWPGNGNLGDYTNQGQLGKYTPFDFYGRYDERTAQEGAIAFAAVCRELLEDGLTPLPFLTPDDHDGFHEGSRSFLKNVWPIWLPIVNPVCKQFVVGLEMDEYWGDPDHQAEMSRVVLESTDEDTDVVFHWTKGTNRNGVWSGDFYNGQDAKQDWYTDNFGREQRNRIVAAIQISDELGRMVDSKQIVVDRIDEIAHHALNHVRVRVLLGELGLTERLGWGRACYETGPNCLGSLAGW